ncbi:MAG TPA: hypothetical protein VK506_06185 [Conexibacter sp.]|nr:hypothetical protein [Conexibacter sp.]
MAIGRLAVRRAAFGRVEIDELVVRRLRVVELEVEREVRPSGGAGAVEPPVAPGP